MSSSMPLIGDVDPMFDGFSVEKVYETMKHVDQVYASLKQMESSESGKEDVEVLWRLALCCNEMAGKCESKELRKDRILEGKVYAEKAHNISPKHFLSAKWAAILTGQLTNFVGVKEKIELGAQMKIYQDEALSMNSADFALLHLRGRYAFSVANLSWIEKKTASMLFGSLPSLTIEDALSDFLAAFALHPHWLENLVYIARCYLAKKDKKQTLKYYAMAADMKPREGDAAETELHAEAQAYIFKH